MRLEICSYLSSVQRAVSVLKYRRRATHRDLRSDGSWLRYGPCTGGFQGNNCGFKRQLIRLYQTSSPDEVEKDLKVLRVSEEDKNLLGHEGDRWEGPLSYSAVSVQGLRPSMEDRHIAVVPELSDGNLSLFGVFDGHAGANCAEFLRHAFPKALFDDPKRLQDSTEATLCQTFLELDQVFCGFAAPRRIPDGSSALVCVVERNPESGLASRLVFGCAGDSRAVVVRRSGKVKQMNRELTPYLVDEAQRIHDEGGFVSLVGDEYDPFDSGTLRVNGILAMTRAFGNVSLKPFVTARPEVTARQLRKDDLYLIVASDGLWDAVSNEEAGANLLKHGAKAGVKRLVELALRRGSTDNITVQAVLLNMADDRIAI